MKGFILLILATLLLLIITFVNVIIVLVKSIKKEGLKGLKSVSGYFQNTAINIDIFANVEFRTFWNTTCQENGYEFGNSEQTISYVLGRNLLDNTLTYFGIILVEILNLFESNHCIKAVKSYNEKHKIK